MQFIKKTIALKTRTLISVLLFSILLSSCTQTIVNEEKTIQLNQQQLKQLSQLPVHWDLKGRIAIIHNKENWHVRFHWIKHKQKFQLRFTGPLGDTQILLEQQNFGNLIENTLTIGKDSYTSTGPINKLLYEHTAMSIPVKSLQYWIFGHFNPQLPYQIIKLSNEQNFNFNIKQLLQENWQIEFSKYEHIKGSNYPTKINAKEGEYKIKIFIRSRLET